MGDPKARVVNSIMSELTTWLNKEIARKPDLTDEEMTAATIAFIIHKLADLQIEIRHNAGRLP